MALVNIQLTKSARVLAYNFLCALTNQTVDELRRVRDIKASLGAKELALSPPDFSDPTQSLVTLTEGDTKWLLKKLNESNVFNGQQDELVLALVDTVDDGLKEYKKQNV